MTASELLARDAPLAAVVRELLRLDPDGERASRVIRRTFDQLYDGGRTGRYRWDQLYKTEKTHFGTLVEINLQREFDFRDGRLLDYCIVGHEVDAKYSQKLWGWMLPPEAVGQLCMVITASDETSRFSIGVVRAVMGALTSGMNRDAKRTLSAAGHNAVVWVHRDVELPPNVLLHLPENELARVVAAKEGQSRVTELFRRAVGRQITRATVETVARQLDPMKRVRGNGGAREHLAREGIAIFGGYLDWQRAAAEALGLPVPGRSEFVSSYMRTAAEPSSHSFAAAGQYWIVGTEAEWSMIPDGFYKHRASLSEPA